MSITEELREYVNSNSEPYYGGCAGGVSIRELLEIADRIDEQYSVKVERLEKYRAAVDAMLKEYIKPDVDADGVPIRIGDTMEWPDGSTAEVIGIGNGVFFYKDDEWDGADWSSVEGKRHVKPDTWERIIGDALTIGWQNGNWNEVASAETHDKLVERCRRLADGI